MFSIILATYNRANLLDRAIQSVVNQDYEDWELIIVDDGSTDATSQVLSKYKDGKIKIFKITNRGVALARNFGLRFCTGEWVTFLDSDDYYLRNHLSSRNDLLEEGVDLYYGGLKVLGSPLLPDVNHPGKTIHADDCTLGGTFFIKRRVLERMGGFPNVPLSCDNFLFKKLISLEYKTMKISTQTYVYDRTGQNSITKDYLMSTI
jgi:glycosyltransferase involved in cell wall biosynthesis